MFKKILVDEDLDAFSTTILASLEKFKIPEIVHVKYCDEGMFRVQKALYDNQPFELLITDLSFKADHRPTKIEIGRELFRL